MNGPHTFAKFNKEYPMMGMAHNSGAVDNLTFHA